jgi:hypothetical protein
LHTQSVLEDLTKALKLQINQESVRRIEQENVLIQQSKLAAMPSLLLCYKFRI